MFNFQALLNDSTLRSDLTSNFGQFFPFYFLNENEKDNALIICPGGGRDVLVALFGDVSSITAVEVNPDLVKIVKDYEDFNGGLYTQLPNVEIVVDEGRRFLRNTSKKYDLLMLALPVTKSSRSIDGYALTENYLFTVEAFGDYLNRLTPKGRIIFVTHGNPASATSILLFSLLLGMGAGSLSSAWISGRLSIAVVFSTVAVFLLSLAYNYLLDDFLVSATSVPLRAGLLTEFIGFAMGFPFPLALRMMNNHGLGEFTAAMWGTNGLASVAGSITAMIIGINWGFTKAGVVGAGLYLLISLLMLQLGQSG